MSGVFGTAEVIMTPLPDISQQDRGPSNRWWMLFLVALAYFVLIQHRSLVGYVQIPLSEELQLTKTQTGWLDTAFLIPYAISQLFVAYLSDRFQRRRVLSVSLMASSLCLVGMSFAGSFGGLLALRIVLGFAQSASVPAIAGVMADCFTPRNRSTAVGIYNLSLNLAFIVVGTMGGRLADLPDMDLSLQWLGIESLSGWRSAMLCFGGVGIVAAVLLGVVMPEPLRTERQAARGLGTGGAAWHQTLWSVLRVRSFVMLALGFLGFCMVDNAQNFWLSRHYVESMQMTNAEAGQFATIWYRPAAFGGLLLGGFLADRWAKSRMRGRIDVQILGMFIWVPTLIVLGSSDSVYVLAPTMAVIGVAYGLYVSNLWTTAFEVIDPAARSTAIGLLNVIAVPASLTSPVIGYLIDQEYVELGQAISGLSVIALVIAALLAINARVFLPGDYHGPLRDS